MFLLIYYYFDDYCFMDDFGFNDVFVFVFFFCDFSGLVAELCVLEDFLCKNFVISFCS